MNGLTIFSIFSAGLLSFLSPCIIPLVPMYVGFLAGDLDEEGNTNRKRLIINTLAFLFGIMLIYALLGATASQLGRFLNINSNILSKVGGVLIIIFGLFQMGIMVPNALKQNKNLKFKVSSGKIGSSFLLGVAFSFGWTPCISPILGSVMAMVASTNDLFIGIFLLIVYSLGFSIPFLITALLAEPIMKKVEKSGNTFKIIKIVTGLLMIGIGVLIFTNKLAIINSLF